MAPVRAPHRGDPRGMPRNRQPVVNRGPDLAAPERRIAPSLMAGNQQDQPVTGGNRLVKPAVDRVPGLVEVAAVEVDHKIGRCGPRTKPPVPGGIQRSPGRRRSRCWRRRWSDGRPGLPPRLIGCDRFGFGGQRLARKRPDRRCHSRPEFFLVSVERAHAPPRRGGAGSAPVRTPPCHRQFGEPPRPRPRRCRAGWLP